MNKKTKVFCFFAEPKAWFFNRMLLVLAAAATFPLLGQAPNPTSFGPQSVSLDPLCLVPSVVSSAWRSVDSILPSIDAIFVNLHGGLVILDKNGQMWTVDCGASQSPKKLGEPWSPDVPRSLTIDPRDPKILYAVTTTGALFKSLDGGDDWALVGSSTLRALSTEVVIDPTDSDTIWVGGPQLWKSEDSGTTWNSVLPFSNAPTVLAINSHLDVIPTILVGMSTGEIVVFNVESGNSIQLPGPERFPVAAIAHDPNAPGEVYIGYRTNAGMEPAHGLYRALDGALNWLPADGTGRWRLPCNSVNSIVVDVKGRVYVTSPDGLFMSPDQGQSWTRENVTPQEISIRSLSSVDAGKSTLHVALTNEGRVFVAQAAANGIEWSTCMPSFVYPKRVDFHEQTVTIAISFPNKNDDKGKRCGWTLVPLPATHFERNKSELRGVGEKEVKVLLKENDTSPGKNRPLTFQLNVGDNTMDNLQAPYACQLQNPANRRPIRRGRIWISARRTSRNAAFTTTSTLEHHNGDAEHERYSARA